MKNQLKRCFISSLILASLFNCTVFAQDIGKFSTSKMSYADSDLLPKTEKTARDVTEVIARSTAMGAAISSITNGTKGVIEIWAETAMYKPVDWACLTVYLERWYEEEESWKIVAEFEKEFLPEDTEDGKLTSATLDVSVSDQPMGYYYRVRAMHELEFDGDWYEARVTKTSGVFMEYIP